MSSVFRVKIKIIINLEKYRDLSYDRNIDIDRQVSYMNNKQLEYAIELSKKLNFSAVAEKFGISQPALSKQISNLEKSLGIALFDRTSNPISLTAAGEHFFREAEKIIYREDQLYRSMEDFKSGKRGKLTIGISPFRSLYLIPKLCKKIKDKFPDIKIVLHEDSSDQLRKMAAEGKFDFAIANLPVDESVLDVIPIEQDKLVVAVPENIASEITDSKSSGTIDFAKCKNIPFIVVGQNQEMRILFEKICTAAETQPKIAMEVVGLTTAWAMVREGIGATLLPLQFIQGMENDSSIKLFVPDCEMNIRQPAIITRHGQYISEYAKYAINTLKENK